jgi:DNA-binding NarL/FixJ family response regulator
VPARDRRVASPDPAVERPVQVSDLVKRLQSLTPQQARVLGMVAEGLLNKQIADRLDVQERTVKAHLTAIFDRLGVRNRTQAGVVLRELELSDPARQL